MASSKKVIHVGKQPTKLDRGPGIVFTYFPGDTTKSLKAHTVFLHGLLMATQSLLIQRLLELQVVLDRNKISYMKQILFEFLQSDAPLLIT